MINKNINEEPEESILKLSLEELGELADQLLEGNHKGKPEKELLETLMREISLRLKEKRSK